MAKKILFNNIEYDIINAISMNDCNYLLMSNPNDLVDIRYVAARKKDGIEHYFLPPNSFKAEENNGVNLKILLINSIINRIIGILKQEIIKDNINSINELNNKIENIKSFCMTDLYLQEVINNNKELSDEGYNKLRDRLNDYLGIHFITKESLVSNNYLGKPFDYDNIYDLSLEELKELASNKSNTSEQLIYIQDALKKRTNTNLAIDDYTESGSGGYQKTKNNKAAFIDIILLSIIVGSFGCLLLISLF